jgi:hypothetical protein
MIGTNYSTTEDELLRLAGIPEAPMVANLDGCWHVVSPMDAWLLLGSQLTREDLQRFGDVVREVLGEPDPTLELAAEDRWRAALDGIRRRYSTSLRRGLANSLALLGSLDDTINFGSGETGRTSASRLVRELLDAAKSDASLQLWTSLADLLPLLAEAAPAAFLDALEHALAGGTSNLANIFTDSEDQDSLTAPTSPHIFFLAALETLGWSPDHFARVVSVCARLTQLDPGGKWANRPNATLASFFCPWHPNTSATADQRINALDRLWRLSPNVAWELAITMLPNSHAIQTVHHGPKYRSWKAGKPFVTQDEYWRVADAAAKHLVDALADDVEPYVSIVERADDLPPASFDALIDKLIELPDRGLPEPEVAKVWKAVRGLLAKHREYADAKWALPEEPLTRLDRAEEALQPSSADERSAWLFEDGWVTLGDLRRRDDYQAYDAAIADRRRDAVSEVAAEGGFAAVRGLAERARVPELVGVALARARGAAFQDQVLPLLDFDPGWEADFAFGYFGQRFRDEDWATIDELVRTTERPRVKARLLLCTRQPQRAWARLGPLGSEVAVSYWQEFSYVGLGRGFSEVEEAASQLTGVGRYAAALDLLALYSREFEDVASYAERVAEAFEGLIDGGGNDPELAQLSHEFDDLLKLLGRHRQAVGAERVVRLEWFFLPALGYSPDATTLHQELADDPSFFVEMVKLRFHPANRSDDEETSPSENQRRMAENAFRLMSSWSRCPGVDAQGDLDGDRMRAWVRRARELLADSDRVEIGDQEIGQALAAAPTDPDGIWPALPVRELFEDLQNANIERGFEVRVRNRRGVTSRDPLSGGDQERKLASDYEAKAEELQSRWPRTAAIMRSLAAAYEADARRWDDQAERRRRGLDW